MLAMCILHKNYINDNKLNVCKNIPVCPILLYMCRYTYRNPYISKPFDNDTKSVFIFNFNYSQTNLP